MIGIGRCCINRLISDERATLQEKITDLSEALYQHASAELSLSPAFSRQMPKEVSGAVSALDALWKDIYETGAHIQEVKESAILFDSLLIFLKLPTVESLHVFLTQAKNLPVLPQFLMKAYPADPQNRDDTQHGYQRKAVQLLLHPDKIQLSLIPEFLGKILQDLWHHIQALPVPLSVAEPSQSSTAGCSGNIKTAEFLHNQQIAAEISSRYARLQPIHLPSFFSKVSETLTTEEIRSFFNRLPELLFPLTDDTLNKIAVAVMTFTCAELENHVDRLTRALKYYFDCFPLNEFAKLINRIAHVRFPTLTRFPKGDERVTILFADNEIRALRRLASFFENANAPSISSIVHQINHELGISECLKELSLSNSLIAQLYQLLTASQRGHSSQSGFSLSFYAENQKRFFEAASLYGMPNLANKINSSRSFTRTQRLFCEICVTKQDLKEIRSSSLFTDPERSALTELEQRLNAPHLVGLRSISSIVFPHTLRTILLSFSDDWGRNSRAFLASLIASQFSARDLDNSCVKRIFCAVPEENTGGNKIEQEEDIRALQFLFLQRAADPFALFSVFQFDKRTDAIALLDTAAPLSGVAPDKLLGLAIDAEIFIRRVALGSADESTYSQKDRLEINLYTDPLLSSAAVFVGNYPLIAILIALFPAESWITVDSMLGLLNSSPNLRKLENARDSDSSLSSGYYFLDELEFLFDFIMAYWGSAVDSKAYWQAVFLRYVLQEPIKLMTLQTLLDKIVEDAKKHASIHDATKHASIHSQYSNRHRKFAPFMQATLDKLTLFFQEDFHSNSLSIQERGTIFFYKLRLQLQSREYRAFLSALIATLHKYFNCSSPLNASQIPLLNLTKTMLWHITKDRSVEQAFRLTPYLGLFPAAMNQMDRDTCLSLKPEGVKKLLDLLMEIENIEAIPEEKNFTPILDKLLKIKPGQLDSFFGFFSRTKVNSGESNTVLPYFQEALILLTSVLCYPFLDQETKLTDVLTDKQLKLLTPRWGEIKKVLADEGFECPDKLSSDCRISDFSYSPSRAVLALPAPGDSAPPGHPTAH